MGGGKDTLIGRGDEVPDGEGPIYVSREPPPPKNIPLPDSSADTSIPLFLFLRIRWTRQWFDFHSELALRGSSPGLLQRSTGYSSGSDFIDLIS